MEEMKELKRDLASESFADSKMSAGAVVSVAESFLAAGFGFFWEEFFCRCQ